MTRLPTLLILTLFASSACNTAVRFENGGYTDFVLRPDANGNHVGANQVEPDLITPKMTDGDPAPGKRVRQFNEDYMGTGVFHVLYLPTNWEKGKRYPVIVEYAGNKWKHGPGTVESCDMGYGISGGKDVIWVSMPYVDAKDKKNAVTWWGDIDASVEYCKKTV